MTDKAPIYVSLSNLLFSIVLPGSFLVFALYWGLVFDGNLHAISVCTHGVNFVVMALDAFVNAQSFKLAHGAYFYIYAIVYLIWTVIFGAAGGERSCTCSPYNKDEPKGCRNMNGDIKTDDSEDKCNYIYGSVNWNAPGSAGSISGAILIIVLPVVLFMFWSLILCRRYARTSKASDTGGRSDAGGESDAVDHRGSTATIQAIQNSDSCCGAVCTSFRNEFRLHRLKLSMTVEEWLHQYRTSKLSFCLQTPMVYLIWRACLFAVMFIILVWSFVDQAVNSQDGIGHYFIYLTNWTLMMQNVYLGLALFCTFKSQRVVTTDKYES
eukprot:TRINITY_DN30376_c4_g1_i1.p1 TRINITY_DN30376_c4_g1~~TRINITY_DN30376_c4_g1_i1.p1  ORF type:complete len:324 (-),score=42.98 TRINITY_DN30376_c4_g1_i1:519-1490(-)